MNQRQSNRISSLCVCLGALALPALLFPFGCSTPFAPCEATASCSAGDPKAGAGGEAGEDLTGGVANAPNRGGSGDTGGGSGGTSGSSGGSGGVPSSSSAGMGGDAQNENGGAGAHGGDAGESGAPPSISAGAAGQATGGDGDGGTNGGPRVCLFGSSEFDDGCVFGR
jgi:hypothetical protein